MDRKLIYTGNAILILLVLAGTLAYFLAKPAAFRGTLYAEPLPPAGEIELAKADGQTFRMSEQRGKIVLLFFGYTSCPDVCPTTLAEMKQVMEKLGDKKDNTRVVFVSVDPGRDTPEKTQEYVSRFSPDFIGLSGSQKDLEPVWQAYGVFREEISGATAAGYTVNHTARTYLIDADGNLRLSYAYGTPVEDIVHDLKLLLDK